MRSGSAGRRATWAALVGIAVASTGPRLAQAAPSPGRVLVLPARVEGNLPPHVLEELEKGLVVGLSRGEFEVDVAKPAQVPKNCADTKCAAGVAHRASADYAVVMTVGVERRDYAITLDLVDAESGAVALRSAEPCEVCGIAEVRAVVDNQAAAIRQRLAAQTLRAPVIVFESTPPGAIVTLDGEVVGQTPFERVVAAGEHRAEARLEGYVSEGRDVEALAGVRERVAFTMQPLPRAQRYRALRTFGWTALGVGAAALVAGITLIAIDGKPNTVDCDGDNVDPRGNCKFLYATGEAGIGVTVVGGVLLATGIGIAIGTRNKRPARPARAHLRLTPTGIAGRF